MNRSNILWLAWFAGLCLVFAGCDDDDDNDDDASGDMDVDGDADSDSDGSGGPIDGIWQVIKFICDDIDIGLAGAPATTFTINNGNGVFENEYSTVTTTIVYTDEDQMDWVVDEGQGGCGGTHHPSTYSLSGNTLTMTEDPAPACEIICGNQKKVTIFEKQ